MPSGNAGGSGLAVAVFYQLLPLSFGRLLPLSQKEILL